MILRIIIGLYALGLFTPCNIAQSQPPSPSSGELSSPEKPNPSNQKKQPKSDQRGTEQSPIIVKIVPSPNAQEEAAQAKREKEEKAATDRRVEITTDIVAGATLIQAIALFWTIRVMNRTGRRQLRAYVFPHEAGLIDGMMLNPPERAHTNEPGVILTIRNSGKTPAYKVVSWAQIAITEPI
jgi:hypothetical protein